MLGTSKVSKQCSNVSVMTNILRTIIHETQKLLQLFDGSGLWPGMTSLHLIWTSMETASFDNMPKVFNRCSTKETLLLFCKQLFLTLMLKYIMQVQHMLFYCWAKHKDVIKVDSHAMHRVGERQIHQMLERCWCNSQLYGDYKVFKQSM